MNSHTGCTLHNSGEYHSLGVRCPEFCPESRPHTDLAPHLPQLYRAQCSLCPGLLDSFSWAWPHQPGQTITLKSLPIFTLNQALSEATAQPRRTGWRRLWGCTQVSTAGNPPSTAVVPCSPPLGFTFQCAPPDHYSGSTA